MKRFVLSLGTNMGDRMAFLIKAKEYIGKRIGDLSAQSSVFETAAWGEENQPEFYNQVIGGFTALTASDLMVSILDIEMEMGRKREVKWSPRIIDIDILFYENEIIEEEGLIIPHPLFHKRRFTLEPLVEILPELIDPRSGKSMQDLLRELDDQLEVRKLG